MSVHFVARLPRSGCGCAFTLIELLVLIAIIAILAAPLLSASDEAKQKAHAIAGAGLAANGHWPPLS